MAARDHFRAHARRRVELGATLQGRDGSWQSVRIRDLGLGGACVEIPDTQAQGGVPVDRETPVMLEVTAPSLWDPLLLRGKISWVRRGSHGRPTRAGIRFEHREAPAIYALFQLLGAQVFDAV
jgi:hypothetical protein